METPNSKYPLKNLADGFNALRVKPMSTAVAEAERDILERSNGTQFALKTSLPKVNTALGGGFQIGNIYYLVGASGGGKSLLRNQIESDFCSPLNAAYPRPFLILNFVFEMSAADEVIRSFSSNTGLSYGEIMSSEKPFDDFHNQRHHLLSIANRHVFFVETSGNRRQILATIHQVHLQFPDHELVIMLDHSLLVEFLDEKDEVALLAALAKDFVRVRKNYPCMIILLGQMNDRIENPLRIMNSSLHFPTKGDIHGSKQVYWAMDYVLMIHRPEELGIQLYGKEKIDTRGLIALHLVKARKGKVGFTRLKANFAKGRIEQMT